MEHARQLSIVALTLAVAAGAAAQQIEISSPSIGTVVVTPPRINATATPGTSQGAGSRANLRGGNGVDLGIKRRRDGTLYDALDPTQNRAAATASTAESRNASTPAAAQSGAASDTTGAAGGLSGVGNGIVANRTQAGTAFGTAAATANPALSGASDVSSNPGAANALSGNSGGTPGAARPNTGGGAGAGAGTGGGGAGGGGGSGR